jgi:hypothetical protein
MLRACALKYGKSWDKSLPYAKFSYNNIYQASVEMTPYWEKVKYLDLKYWETQRSKSKWFTSLKDAQTWQKSYVDKRRRDLSFEIGDFVYLKVSPTRGTRRFNVKGKLVLRYIGPFQVIDRKGEVAYQLELPPQLSDVHDVFHVSQLKKCLWVP